MTMTIEPTTDISAEPSTTWPAGEILRDISRGGLAGIVVGLVVAGLGGRIVMRIAALVVFSKNTPPTENGNRIGDITLGGSLGLIVFVGPLAAIFFGVVWVVISPWLPGTGLAKGLVAMPIAVALGAFGLIDGNNPDFLFLRRDPIVVAILIALVASIGPAMALADGWLDRHLPHAESRESSVGTAYLVLTLIGGVLGGMLLGQAVLGQQSKPLGITVLVVGLVTLAWWYQRVHGRRTPSRALTVAGRTAMLFGTIAGFVVLIPEVSGALGLGRI